MKNGQNCIKQCVTLVIHLLKVMSKKSYVIEIRSQEKEKNWKIIQEITMHVEQQLEDTFATWTLEESFVFPEFSITFVTKVTLKLVHYN